MRVSDAWPRAAECLEQKLLETEFFPAVAVTDGRVSLEEIE